MNKAEEVLDIAKTLFVQQPSWDIFFREILGVEGAVRKIYGSESREFKKTDQCKQVNEMLTNLRGKEKEIKRAEEIKVITVRLPISLHRSLKDEAHDHHLTLNRLCVQKLLSELEE